MASLLKLLVEVFGGFFTGFFKVSGDAIVRTHEGLESAFESLIVGISEILFQSPVYCYDNQCLAGTLATATMWSVAVFLVMACFERFRWVPALGGLFGLFLVICFFGRAGAHI